MEKHLDVVGLEYSTRDRSCSDHETCGRHIQLGAVLRIEQEEDAEGKRFAVYAHEGGCKVGFLPRRLLNVTENPTGVLLRVKKLYSTSENSADRRRSHQYGGLALTQVVFTPNA